MLVELLAKTEIVELLAWFAKRVTWLGENDTFRVVFARTVAETLALPDKPLMLTRARVAFWETECKDANVIEMSGGLILRLRSGSTGLVP